MRRIALLSSLAFAFSTSAIAGKNKKKKNKDNEPPAASAPVPEIPGDGLSKKFVKRLMESPLRNFNPMDQLSYGDLVFKPDNTWSADGKVTLGLEEDTCTETGTWKMDPAEAEDTAIVSWVVIHSDCVGAARRGSEIRALLTIAKDGGYTVKMR